MEVAIVRLSVPDLAEATRQGASHPILGRLLDAGSWCAVEGVADASEILAAAHAAASQVEGLNVVSDPAAGLDLPGLGERAALCAIVADGAKQARPLAILYGRGLPALGALPPCTVRDLQATWIALAGGTPAEGRHLLQEQPEAWDPQLERQLTQRLRQLYGE